MKKHLLIFLLFAAFAPLAGLANPTHEAPYRRENLEGINVPSNTGLASLPADWIGKYKYFNSNVLSNVPIRVCDHNSIFSLWPTDSYWPTDTELMTSLGDNSIIMPAGNYIQQGIEVYLITPYYNSSISSISFTAWKEVSLGTLELGYTYDYDENTFHSLYTVPLVDHTQANLNNTSFTYSVALPTSNNYRLAFKWRCDTEDCYSAFLDNVCVYTYVPNTHIANTSSSTQMTWDEFAQNVNNGITYEGQTVYLNSNVTATTRAGYASDSDTKSFHGTFDGQGHTITFNFNANSTYAAPFACVKNATFLDLKTAGTITANTKRYAGGIAGMVISGSQNCTFTNCESNVTITSTSSGTDDCRHGGFVANVVGGNVTFNGCAFTGGFSGTNAKGWGGFVGYFNHYVYFTDCIFSPTSISINNQNNSTFACPSGTQVITFTNCYYTQSLGGSQGKQRYTITAESPATVAMSGTATNHNVSHLTAYSDNQGLVYNNAIVAGEGDNVSLNLDGANFYITDHGIITGNGNPYTLAMGANNTIISIAKNHIASTASDTQMTWDEFAQNVNNGYTYEGQTIYLDSDVTATTMAGTNQTNCFKGTFEGQGHTLTFNYTTTEWYTAPFRCLNGATIQNLKVNGTITTNNGRCGGLAGHCYGDNTFTNCLSDITINSSRTGDGTHGGFVSIVREGTTTFESCTFTGRLLGSNTYRCGGFVGWTVATANFNNCVFDPVQVTITNTNSATFARPNDDNPTTPPVISINNCYYTYDFNDGTNYVGQGKQAYTITGQSPVSVAMNGTATYHNVSRIKAYSGNPGLVYNGTVIAGEGDIVSLNLGGALSFNADHGTLSGTANPYTLSMEAYNTTISAVTPLELDAITIGQLDTYYYTMETTLAGRYGYNYSVYIYRPEDSDLLNFDFDLASLAFNVTRATSTPIAEMTLWVKDVDADFLTIRYWTFSEYIDGATQVYDSQASFAATMGWNTFNLTTNFSHEGGKALLVAVRSVGTNLAGSGSTNNWNYCSYTSQTRSHWRKCANNTDPGTAVDGEWDGYDKRADIQLGVTYTSATCFIPSDLTVAYPAGIDTEVTLGWTENGEATAWQICLNDDETNLIDANTNPFTLTGLTPETLYYAKVRANCGDLHSNWSDAAIMQPTLKTVIGMYDAVDVGYLPTNIFENYSMSEQIYTTDELGEAASILSLDFFNNSTGSATRNLKIYMAHCDVSSPSSNSWGDWINITPDDLVFSGNVNFASKAWTSITLNTPFDYNGTQNVVLKVADNTGSGSGQIYFLNNTNPEQIKRARGVFGDQIYDPTDETAYQQAYATTNRNYIRLMKAKKPTGLQCTAHTHITADLSWTENGNATAWQICLNDDMDRLITVTTNPSYTLTNLNSETLYTAKVRANCGIGYTAWSAPISFETTNKLVVGSGTEAWVKALPTNTEMEYSLTEQIYTSAELGEAGSIVSIDFYRYIIDGGSQPCTRDLDIYMVHTDKESFETTTDWVFVTEADRVFSGTVSFVYDWWTTINFSKPFTYDGQHNVVLVVNDKTGTGIGVTGFLVYNDDGYSALFRTTYYQPFDPTSGSGMSNGYWPGCKNQLRLKKQTQVTLPYSTGFETDCDWELINGNCRNAWVRGTAVNHGGTHSLYISRDGGATPVYQLVGYPSTVYCAKTFYLEAGIHYNFTYDWRAFGETGYDFMRVALVPASIALEASTTLPNGFSHNTLPSGWIPLDGGSQLNLSPYNFETASYDAQVPADGFYKMVFAWRNNEDGGNNGPAVVDNVSVTPMAGAQSTNLQCTAHTYTTADLSWTENGTATAWQVCLNGDETNLVTVTTNPCTLTNLAPETVYSAKVRAICGENGFSAWSMPVSFETTYKLVVGSGTGTWVRDLPSNTEYAYSLTEQIYTPADFGDAGNIVGIDFYRYIVDGGSQPCTRDLDIYMVHTDKESFETTNDWAAVTEADRVFSGTVSFVYDWWTAINFSKPFAYDGQHNVVLVVNDKTGTGIGITGFLGYKVEIGNICSIFNHGSNPFDPTSAFGESYSWVYSKNQLRLKKVNSAMPAFCDVPTALSATPMLESATLTWEGAHESYNVQYRPITQGQTEWIERQVTETTIDITGLDSGTTYEWRVQGINLGCENGVTDWSETVRFTTQSLLTKEIVGYDDGNANWYLMTSPYAGISPDDIEGMTEGDYDLYRFNPSHEGEEWENYENGNFSLVNGQGYLYANREDVTLTFCGVPVAVTEFVEVPLTYDANDDHKCWNLVGNPFNCNAYLNKDYYILNNECTGINPNAVSSSTPIPPCTAVFVKATSAGDKVAFMKHKYVDLGLPSGLLWATCNIGAGAPEEYGDYFAWGEITPKSVYDWTTYQYCNGSSNTMTKYCNYASYGYEGFTDNLTTLLPEDDAATANWGGNWRMPTKEEFQELYNNTTMTWTQQNGVNGYLFTATNGNSLFLPATGYRYGSYLFDADSNGYFWSSSLYTDYANYAWYFFFNSGNYGMDRISRFNGRTVRPVRSAAQR